MEHDIQQAFQQVHAEPQMKENTRQYLKQVRRQRQHRQKAAPLRRAVCAAALCCLALAAVGGYKLYFTATSVISIDINPSIELDVNRFDRVIAVQGYNDDGQALADTLDILYLEYDQAVDTVLTSPAVTACLEQDEFLSIAVVQSDEAQGQQILEYVSSCTAHTPNSHCYGIQQQQAEDAHSLGLSYGKYLIYQQLLQYGADYTPQQVNDMTMRQLRQILEQLQADGFAPQQQESASSSQPAGAGHHDETEEGHHGENGAGYHGGHS